MTTNLPALALDAFIDQIQTVRRECATNSPAPLTEYSAIVAISHGMWMAVEKAMADLGMIPHGLPFGPKFTYSGVSCVVIAAPGIWSAARVLHFPD
jgi:hypothetical protein